MDHVEHQQAMSQFCSHNVRSHKFFNTNARVKPQFMHSCENANIKKVHFFLAGHITMNPFLKRFLVDIWSGILLPPFELWEGENRPKRFSIPKAYYIRIMFSFLCLIFFICAHGFVYFADFTQKMCIQICLKTRM